ncbi:MAG: DinB family protein [Vicinamibacterales bacterium]
MSQVALLLSLIDEAFDHKSWHGTTLYGALRGLDVAVASARPKPDRRNIWELIVHAAYWKYTVRRRLTGEKRGSFPLEGSNWFERPGRLTAAGDATRTLKSDIQLLVAEHRRLRETVARVDEAMLHERFGEKTRAWLIRGIAAHDLYHAGQIQLLKRLIG